MDARLEASLARRSGRGSAGAPARRRRHQPGVRGRAADGRAVFVKCNVSAPNDMFVAEARGLAWLGEAKALRVPTVLAASGANDLTPFLALELIRPAPRAGNFDERLGRGLAALHRHGAQAFGLDHDNYVGRLPQKNTFAVAWSEFYRVRRLGHSCARRPTPGWRPRACGATSNGCSPSWRRCADRPAPARLHATVGRQHDRGRPGRAVPDRSGGVRRPPRDRPRDDEAVRGLRARVFAAYKEALPLADGSRERVP